MIEAEDPLEGGLEIIAKPPGKKPATLSLLSGGEQSLTAMALIFAVFLTNPSPICVLDEVDAPLDDANVDRFCTLLEKMSADTATRFLVITHHPMTMSRMNRLFGVTMAREGREPARVGGPGDGAEVHRGGVSVALESARARTAGYGDEPRYDTRHGYPCRSRRHAARPEARHHRLDSVCAGRAWGRRVPPIEDLAWAIGPPLRTTFPKLLGEFGANRGGRGPLPRELLGGAMYDAVVYPASSEALDALAASGCRLHRGHRQAAPLRASPILEHFDLARHFTAIHGPELDGTSDQQGRPHRPHHRASTA